MSRKQSSMKRWQTPLTPPHLPAPADFCTTRVRLHPARPRGLALHQRCVVMLAALLAMRVRLHLCPVPPSLPSVAQEPRAAQEGEEVRKQGGSWRGGPCWHAEEAQVTSAETEPRGRGGGGIIGGQAAEEAEEEEGPDPAKGTPHSLPFFRQRAPGFHQRGQPEFHTGRDWQGVR